MNCPNPQCGKPVSEGAKFCTRCGTKIEPVAAIVAEEPLLCPNPQCRQPVEADSKFCTCCGTRLSAVTPVTGGVVSPERKTTRSGDKKPGRGQRKKKPIAIIAAGAVVALLLIVVAVKVFVAGGILGGGSSGSAIVILQDGYYKLLTSVDAEESITIAALGSDYAATYKSVAFSSNGKYIYFMTEYDSSEGTGTLNRVEYSKLKSNSDNSGCVEVVDTDIPDYVILNSGLTYSAYGYTVLEDGTALYVKNYDSRSYTFDLYFFDGKESICICESVESYYADDEGRVIWANYDSGSYTLYGVKLSNPDKIITLADGIKTFLDCEDLDAILYAVKNTDTGTYDLYSVDFNAKSTLLLSDVSYSNITDTRTIGEPGDYIIVKEEGVVTLYSYVQDSYAKSDAAATNPSEEVQSRIALRERLQDESNGIETYTIYTYIDGSLTAVCKNVIEYIRSNGVLLAYTTDILSSGETIDINDVSSVSEVNRALYSDVGLSGCLLINPSDGKVYTISDDAAETLEDALGYDECGWGIYADYFYLFTEEGVVYAAPLSKSTLGTLTVIAGGNGTGSSVRYTYIYENGLVWTTGTEGSMLYSSDGTVIYSGSNVPKVTEDAILYYSDGNLYQYISEEESVLVASDVRGCWLQSGMEVEMLRCSYSS